MTPVPEGSILQRLAHAIRDHDWIVVFLESHGALEAVGVGNQHLESALERVGRDPRFVRAGDALPARDDGRLDALAAMAGNAVDVENRERHEPPIVAKKRSNAMLTKGDQDVHSQAL